ncbi:MAG: LptF/LptG family permease [Leptospirales bacterium]
MKQILDRYFFTEFLKYFLGALILLTGVSLISKTMERLQIILEYSGPALDTMLYLLLNIPYFISIVGAPALMFSVAFTIAMFSRNKELSVVLAAGRSFLRTLAPISIFTLFFSVGLFFFNEFIAYPSYYESMNQLQVLKENTEFTREMGRVNFHGKLDNIFYNAGLYEIENNLIHKAHMVEMDEAGNVKKIIKSDYAIPIEGHWILINGSIKEFLYSKNKKEGAEKISDFEMINIDFRAGPEFFRKIRQSFDEMNIINISEELEARKLRGANYREYQVELYWHYSFPFVCFFIVFIGGILGAQVKKGAMSMSIGISTGLTIGYYLVMFFGKSLANNGTLHPLFGAWLANIVFGTITVVILWRYRF